MRPRGLHLPEKHVDVDDGPLAGSFFDFGLYLFHNGRRLLDRGTGPYLYLPKLESHLEARLWNDVFTLRARSGSACRTGSIKATVLIETILAAFEMDEILWELREHAAGLNAGRWDYMFSVIKTFRERPEFVLPDRNAVTMTAPFMRAYAQLLVKTCHRRGAHAMGGMAAFIPSRRDAELNEKALAKVREDKVREAGDGFDGTWVAHPGPRPGRARRVRPVAEPARPAARGRLGRRRGPARRVVHTRRSDGGRAAQRRERRPALPEAWLDGTGACRDLQPDGGRRHRRDRPLADLAVGAPRRALATATSTSCASSRRRARAEEVSPRRPRALRAGRPRGRLRRIPDPARLRPTDSRRAK